MDDVFQSWTVDDLDQLTQSWLGLSETDLIRMTEIGILSVIAILLMVAVAFIVAGQVQLISRHDFQMVRQTPFLPLTKNLLWFTKKSEWKKIWRSQRLGWRLAYAPAIRRHKVRSIAMVTIFLLAGGVFTLSNNLNHSIVMYLVPFDRAIDHYDRWGDANRSVWGDGLSAYQGGHWSVAEDHFNVLYSDTSYPYALILKQLSAIQSGADRSDLIVSEPVHKLDWPNPILGVMNGSWTLIELEAYIEKLGLWSGFRERCDTYFVVGELAKIGGHREQASRLLSRAQDACLHDSAFLILASKAQERLGDVAIKKRSPVNESPIDEEQNGEPETEAEEVRLVFGMTKDTFEQVTREVIYVLIFATIVYSAWYLIAPTFLTVMPLNRGRAIFNAGWHVTLPTICLGVVFTVNVVAWAFDYEMNFDALLSLVQATGTEEGNVAISKTDNATDVETEGLDYGRFVGAGVAIMIAITLMSFAVIFLLVLPAGFGFLLLYGLFFWRNQQLLKIQRCVARSRTPLRTAQSDRYKSQAVSKRWLKRYREKIFVRAVMLSPFFILGPFWMLVFLRELAFVWRGIIAREQRMAPVYGPYSRWKQRYWYPKKQLLGVSGILVSLSTVIWFITFVV